MVPVVLRFRDATGVKEQPVLFRADSETVPLAAEGAVAWCIGNAESRGFYRTAYDDATLARLMGAVGDLRPAERIALISDQWALVRAGLAPIERFCDLVVSLREEEDHVVLDEVVSRLALIEHRFLADGDRALFGAFVRELYGARAMGLGWAPKHGEDDETRLRRAVLVRALALIARIRTRPPRRRSASHRRSDRRTSIRTCSTWSSPRRRARRTWRASKTCARGRGGDRSGGQATLSAPLARVEDPGLTTRAVELSMSEDVPMQDFSSFVGVLLANRETREAAFAMINDRWQETRAKADSPMILRRLVESLATLPERRHLEAVRRSWKSTLSTARARPSRRRWSGCRWTSRCASASAAHRRLATRARVAGAKTRAGS